MIRQAIFTTAFAFTLAPHTAEACPFCTAEQATLTEELATSDAAVIARLVRPAPSLDDAPSGPLDPDAGKAGFEAVHVLFGEDKLAGQTALDAIYFGEPDKQASYLIRGMGEPLEWAIPLKLTKVGVEYVKRLQSLPESGAERIAFFQDYLQHEDPMLAQDAYDEFARAPYADVKGIKDRMDREQLLAWIEDPSVSPSRRRLFLTMLGVCGKQEDIPRLEAMLISDSRVLVPATECLAAASLTAGGPLAMVLSPESIRLDERRKKLGLDAMIACYLTLHGPEGLELIDERFLKTKEVVGKLPDYSHIYSALMALRFLGEESDLVPMERVLSSARLLLDNPDFADQVIPDLARWEDWSVLERLTDMYRLAGDKESGVQKYVREPIITYLDVAAESEGELAQRATAALASIEAIDPDAVRRARSLRAFGFLGRAVKPTTPVSASADPPDPVGLSSVGEEPLVIAEDVASDEIPDPAGFDQAASNETPESPAEDDTLAQTEDAVEPAENSPSETDTAIAADPPPEPPSRALLIAAPTLAAMVCFGLFWVILRSGAA